MPVHGPEIPARLLPVLAKVVKNPLNHVAWWASLTAHPVIVDKLGGLGDQLAHHCLWLVGNLQKEAAGIDVPPEDRTQPSTARAVRVHKLGKIFEEHPGAANYVLDGVATLTLDAHRMADPGFTADQWPLLEDDLNHFALRHGLPSHWATPDQRQERFVRHLGEFTPFPAGPEVFWDVALSPLMLGALGLLPKTLTSVDAAIGLLKAHHGFRTFFAPYIAEGNRQRDAMVANL
jgi:hypothetical protein